MMVIKENSTISTKILSTLSTLILSNIKYNVFNIDNNNKCFLSSKSGFLEDHVTQKPGVMMLKIHICHHRDHF